jgi:hypothetical protein
MITCCHTVPSCVSPRGGRMSDGGWRKKKAGAGAGATLQSALSYDGGMIAVL